MAGEEGALTMTMKKNGVPAAALRGGVWDHGPGSGAFALALNHGPSFWAPSVGLRCAVRR
jgi:hypothetical protein